MNRIKFFDLFLTYISVPFRTEKNSENSNDRVITNFSQKKTHIIQSTLSPQTKL